MNQKLHDPIDHVVMPYKPWKGLLLCFGVTVWALHQWGPSFSATVVCLMALWAFFDLGS